MRDYDAEAKKMKKQFIIMSAIGLMGVILLWGAIGYAVSTIASHVQETGLKNIVNDVWEGSNTQK